MYYDLMSKREDWKINCLDKGFVELIDVMPRLVPDESKTADFAIVQAARVSYSKHKSEKLPAEDRGLIRYLMRHGHTTPTEMVEFKFHCKMPIFVARQWIRHRTANVNELSGRYSKLNSDFYIPTLDNVRSQSTSNKQGSTVDLAEKERAEDFISDLDELYSTAYAHYENYLEKGVGKEQARMLLPLSLYTEWYWKIDLHNLFHFLGLRCDSHAQYEIKVFADAMLDLITPIVPISVEAWNDYHPLRGAVKLSRLEIEAIKNGTMKINSDNKREQEEWYNKAVKFGFLIEDPKS